METNEKSRVLDMTRGNPFRLVLKFALPLFFGNLLQQFYNLADTAIAGHVLGDHALAQISKKQWQRKFRRYMDLSRILHLE